MGEEKLLGVDDVLRLARPGAPRASRRGLLAVAVARPDPERNRVVSEILVSEPGEWEEYIQGEGLSTPDWSPSGALAFAGRIEAGKEEKGSGVYIAGPRGLRPRLVAWLRMGAWGLRWLDSGRLVVGSFEPRGWMYDGDGDYVATDRLPLWFDGEGLVAGRTRQLFLLDAWSGRVERLTSSSVGVSGFEACSGRIYYYEPRSWRDPLDHVLYELEPGSRPRAVLEGLTISQLSCSHGRLYLVGHRRPIGIASHNRVFLLGPGGGLECLTCGLDRNVWSAGEGPEGLLVVYADRGRGVLAELVDGELRDYGLGDIVVYYASSGGGRVYALLSTPTRPPDIYLVAPGRMERVTRFNAWIDEYKLAEPRRLEVEAAGDRVEGWVLLPPEGAPSHGGRRPLVLFIHGGPKGMYGYMFSYEMQLFAAKGFVVAYANPRGSDGYSEEFADIRGKYGDADYEQLMAFLDRVLEELRGEVDEAKMVVTGISYGGYLTNVIITRTRRFAAAVPENGVADWIADYWASDVGYWFDPDQIGGTPLDNLEEYVRRSPAFRAGSVETPVLTIHSMEDYRCFIDQALAMHSALLAAGKESVLVVFTRGSHGHSVRAAPRHRRKRLELKLAWIAEKLGLRIPGVKRLGGGAGEPR